MTHIHHPAPPRPVHHAPVRTEHHATTPPPAKAAAPPSSTGHANAQRPHANEGPRTAAAPRTVSSPAQAQAPTHKTEPTHAGHPSKSPWGVDGFERPAHESDDEHIGETGQAQAHSKAFDWLRTGIANAGEAGEAALASVKPLLRQGDLWLRQRGGHKGAITGVDTSRVADDKVARGVADTVKSVAGEHKLNNVGVKVVEPSQWREHLRAQGIGADDHHNIALYDARTHTIHVNSDIAKRGVGAQREIIGEELIHADQNMRLKDVGPNGTNLAYIDQVGRIFGEAKGTDNGAAVGSALAQGYERLGYTPEEARSKAGHALENWAECDAALRTLWRSHPETNEALKQLCPQMDRALQREARGESIVRNTAFAEQLKDPARAKDFAKVHDLSETDEKKLERAVNSSWVPWHGIERLLDGKYDFSDRVRQSGTSHHGRWNNTASFTIAAVPSTAQAASQPQRVSSGSPRSVGGYPAAQMPSVRTSASALSAPKSSVTHAAPAASGNAWTSVAPRAQSTSSQATIQRAQVSAQPIAAPQQPPPPATQPTQLATAEAQAKVTEAQAKAAEARAEARAEAAEARAEARAEAAEALAENEAIADTLDTPETWKDAAHERATAAVKGLGQAKSHGVRFGDDPMAGGRTIDDVVLKANSGALNGADFELLAHATQTPEGGRNLADALEWMISQPNGDRRMIDLLAQASQSGNTIPMAQALARMAQASPEQALGLLLLATDASDGPAHMARLFGAMADKPMAAAHFATMFEGLTRTPQTAASMSEFLDTVTRASFEDESGSRVMARILRGSSTPSAGADSLVKGLSRTLETEGGARSFARVLSRISTSAADSAAFLENLSNRETGNETVGRLMTRATASRDGARQVLDSFTRMASANGNEKKTGEVVARIIGSQSGSKFVSNLASDPQSARQLESVLARLDTTSLAVGDRLAKAFDHLMAGPEAMALRARAEESPALARIIDRFVDSRATAPLAASSEAPEARATRTAQPRAQQRGTSTDDFRPHARENARAAAPDMADPATPPTVSFRPADVYSQGTLKMARICGDCGFRLTAGGRCVRCDSGQAREAAMAGRTQGVGAF